ncbi:NAD(P)/FAD-dependent oxidoreductase [Halomicroarcula sp. GCM10025894]|uniref:NAD(P)/FAD-dependent oxidoreductase n=1 Tax=Halomicroarcula sp. GCM10025894 TaxID=3252673 RepID=UPI00360A0235
MDDSLSPPDLPEGRHESVWFPTSDRTDYEPLDGDRTFDTAVVGGGIAGITTAAKLDEAGQTVAILERDRILDGTTGHTTAKVTSLHGLVYDTLIENFGAEKARQYAAANQAAVDDIAATVDRRDIDCGFGRAPAYTYAKTEEERSSVRSEVNAARRLGLPASYVEETELPYEVDSAVRFDDQAYFHPRQYLLEPASDVAAGDSAVFEETTVGGVEDGTPCRVETDRGTVRADDVVVASHFPVADDALYFSRLRPKRSYVVAARLDGAPPRGYTTTPASRTSRSGHTPRTTNWSCWADRTIAPDTGTAPKSAIGAWNGRHTSASTWRPSSTAGRPKTTSRWTGFRSSATRAPHFERLRGHRLRRLGDDKRDGSRAVAGRYDSGPTVGRPRRLRPQPVHAPRLEVRPSLTQQTRDETLFRGLSREPAGPRYR